MHNCLMSCLHLFIPGHVHVLPTVRERWEQRNIREHQIDRELRIHIKYPPPTPRFTLSLYYSAAASREAPYASADVRTRMAFVKVQFCGCTFSPLFSRRILWSRQYKPSAFDLVQCEPCLCRGQATESIGSMLHHQLELQIMSSTP